MGLIHLLFSSAFRFRFQIIFQASSFSGVRIGPDRLKFCVIGRLDGYVIG